MRGAVAPLLINHASQHEDFRDHPGLHKYGIESYIAVPLYRRDGECFGTLCALDPRPAELSGEELDIFQLFADLIAYELESSEQQAEREEELKLARQSSERRARFMGILGHDLRSPLNTIVMAATMQKRGQLSAEQNVEMAEKVLKTAKRMQFLIDDLLDTTQAVQGNEIFIERKPADLREILQHLIEEFRIAYPERTIEFNASDRCYGDWDEGRLGQVLSNLLSNALHYGTPDRPVTIDLIEDCDQVRLRVNNRGEPISEELKNNLFAPFWRGARKRGVTPNSSGLGLGLFIVKQIVESHGGEIEVESDEENGTTFTIVLERIRSAASAPAV